MGARFIRKASVGGVDILVGPQKTEQVYQPSVVRGKRHYDKRELVT